MSADVIRSITISNHGHWQVIYIPVRLSIDTNHKKIRSVPIKILGLMFLVVDHDKNLLIIC